MDDTAFREALQSSHEYQFLIHDRDPFYSAELDEQVRSMGLVVVKTPVRAPKANALCERLIGTIRRECLDFLIPLGEKHLRRILRDYVRHYNEGRPHSSLGPGIPDGLTAVPIRSDHSIEPGSIVRSGKCSEAFEMNTAGKGGCINVCAAQHFLRTTGQFAAQHGAAISDAERHIDNFLTAPFSEDSVQAFNSQTGV